MTIGIAPFLTEPLVLVGFALFLFLGLLRALLKSKPMKKVGAPHAGQALLNGLRYGFVIALVVILAGFAYAAYKL